MLTFVSIFGADRRHSALSLGAWIFLQILAKGIQFLLPELLVRVNPVRHFFERLRVEPIEALASHFAYLYQTRFTKDLQVLGNRWQRHIKRFSKLLDGLFAVTQPIQNCTSR